MGSEEERTVAEVAMNNLLGDRDLMDIPGEWAFGGGPQLRLLGVCSEFYASGEAHTQLRIGGPAPESRDGILGMMAEVIDEMGIDGKVRVAGDSNDEAVIILYRPDVVEERGEDAASSLDRILGALAAADVDGCELDLPEQDLRSVEEVVEAMRKELSTRGLADEWEIGVVADRSFFFRHS